MGSPEGEAGRFDDERPQHTVIIDCGIAVSRYPITFAQYDYFCGATKRQLPDDAGWGRERRPVINVSWDDATAYTNWLSRETGQLYRLPTEAEWEYMCRAGSTTRYSGGDLMSVRDANYASSKIGEASEVGRFAANPWGVFDMHGNVWEWCLDGKRIYESGDVVNPVGPLDPIQYRVTRGGAWSAGERYLRSAFRHADPPTYKSNDIGFRCVRLPLK
jgi:formylglycine-generating enzyme required for sulfatase activity